jgi:phage baseplate assembly protein W
MSGIDAVTGETLSGFDHVLQSLEKIFNTSQGARVMREWFGNPGLKLLGENMTDETILLWFNTLYMLVELFEPRFRIVKFYVDDLDRLGFAEFTIVGEYRPYAHLDWVQASAFVSVNDNTVSLRSAA